jgi:hypothetical protein
MNETSNDETWPDEISEVQMPSKKRSLSHCHNYKNSMSDSIIAEQQENNLNINSNMNNSNTSNNNRTDSKIKNKDSKFNKNKNTHKSKSISFEKSIYNERIIKQIFYKINI